ncbi:MAG TPA: LacI family DNA-binding transcriptional regulator [Chloroflexia bacterium]|nr:LacI family DNA-binding transcriptional regulator [Chloroflexia bacterium]
MKKDVSLEMVARRAGVAKSTVSFVLNNKDNVAPQTREKVLAALRELGYMKETQFVPAAVPGVSSQEKKNILVYVNPVVRENEVVNNYMAGLRDYANEKGSLTFSFAMSSTEVESSAQLDFLEQATQPQAILMISINSDHPFMRQALKNRKPCLVINRVNEHPNLSYVSINHKEAGHDAARYLLSYGHHHFLIVVERYYNETEITRLEGFLEELAASQPRARVALVRRFKAPEQPDDYQAATLTQMLKDGKIAFNSEVELRCPESLEVINTDGQLDENFMPTCLVAANDRTTVTVQTAIQAAGLSVPHDVSVMSLNSSSLSLSASPQITAIDELWQEQGYLAGQVLEDLIDHKLIRCQKIQIQHRLIERGSTARPRHS